MAEVEDRFVKTGFWINWSQGSLMGRTLTVDANLGTVVVAILTIFTSIGTAQLFHLLTFLYHQFRASGQPADGLFWQQQALLRTLPPPTGVVADYIKLWWSWRAKANRAHWRSWLPASAVLLYAAAAIAAGISSSYIVDTSNLEVLVDSPLCRMLNITSMGNIVDGAMTYDANMQGVLESYSENCYKNTTKSPATCRNIFVQPKVSFNVTPASCPWDSSMCSDEEKPAIALDSGLLDVSHQFGWNLKDRDNLWLRKKTTCNILPIDDHYDIIDLSIMPSYLIGYDPLQGEEAIAMRYGTYNIGPPEEHPEYLMFQSLLSANRSMKFTSTGLIARLHPEAQWGVPWSPLESMNNTDADVALNFVTFNNVRYSNPVDDPFFSAHQTRLVGPEGQQSVSYRSDNVARVMGCAVQVQYCAAQPKGDKVCSTLSGQPSQVDTVGNELPNLTDLQRSLLRVLWSATYLNDITNGPSKVKLLASELLSGDQIKRLPSDQWIKEIISWENLAWAGLTITLSDTAIGAKVRDSAADEYTDAPATEGDNVLCHSFKMRKAGGFANINIFGLSFVVGVSSTVFLINFFIIRFFVFLMRFRRTLAPRLDRWVNDGVYQLQRRAFDANEQGIWTDLEKEVPITTEKMLIAELPIMRRAGTDTTLMDLDFGLKSDTNGVGKVGFVDSCHSVNDLGVSPTSTVADSPR